MFIFLTMISIEVLETVFLSLPANDQQQALYWRFCITSWFSTYLHSFPNCSWPFYEIYECILMRNTDCPSKFLRIEDWPQVEYKVSLKTHVPGKLQWLIYRRWLFFESFFIRGTFMLDRLGCLESIISVYYTKIHLSYKDDSFRIVNCYLKIFLYKAHLW